MISLYRELKGRSLSSLGQDDEMKGLVCFSYIRTERICHPYTQGPSRESSFVEPQRPSSSTLHDQHRFGYLAYTFEYTTTHVPQPTALPLSYRGMY